MKLRLNSTQVVVEVGENVEPLYTDENVNHLYHVDLVEHIQNGVCLRDQVDHMGHLDHVSHMNHFEDGDHVYNLDLVDF